MFVSDATRASRRTRGSTITTRTRSAAIMTQAALRLHSRSRTLMRLPRRLTWGCRLVEAARLLSRRRSCRRRSHSRSRCSRWHLSQRNRNRRNLTRPSLGRHVSNWHINRRHINHRLSHSWSNHTILTKQRPEPFTDRVQPCHQQAHKPLQADLGADLLGQLNLSLDQGRQLQAHQTRHRQPLTPTRT